MEEDTGSPEPQEITCSGGIRLSRPAVPARAEEEEGSVA